MTQLAGFDFERSPKDNKRSINYQDKVRYLQQQLYVSRLPGRRYACTDKWKAGFRFQFLKQSVKGSINITDVALYTISGEAWEQYAGYSKSLVQQYVGPLQPYVRRSCTSCASGCEYREYNARLATGRTDGRLRCSREKVMETSFLCLSLPLPLGGGLGKFNEAAALHEAVLLQAYFSGPGAAERGL